MGDENTVLSEAETRHLLRRTGFGVNPNLFAQIKNNGESRGQAADRLLDFVPTGFKPKGSYIDLAHNKWIKYMTRTSRELQEKLVLFWHDHFATNFNVVGDVKLMSNQNRLLRQHCKGNFKQLMKAVNTDAAMMEFLDTVRNRKFQPNENYARELQELFTLGVTDLSPGHEPNYDQENIVQIARAFSGWRYNEKGVAYFDDNRHDYAEDWPARGPKVIFKNRGGFGNPSGQDFTVNGEGEAEIGTVIDIIFQHRDAEGENTVARYVARRLFTYFAYADPDISTIDQIVGQSMFDVEFDIAKLLRALFVNDAFYETMQAPALGTKKSVKWPVDYVVSTLRALHMKLKSKYQYVDGGSYEDIRGQLTNMGQVLLEPPSVFGWEWETAWLSSATLLARYSFARDLCSARGGGGGAFRPERLFDLAKTDPGDIVDMVTDVLGVTDQFIADERQKLIDYLTDGTGNDLDLDDYDTRNRKLHGLVALVLQSPAYQLH